MQAALPIDEILRNGFGYDAFRPLQEEIIRHVMDGRDAMVIMPTGGGKSLCYQIPAMAQEGFALVVSPLIALMTDQVQALRANGIGAAAVNSNATPEEIRQAYEDIDTGKVKLLYVSPEKVLTPRFLQYLEDRPVSLIAIDEAHCVSVWGNDFRPEYGVLHKLVGQFPGLPVLALTATADKATQKDIAIQLGLRDPRLFLSSFERKNIFISVRPGQRRMQQLLKFLERRRDQAGIVYCLSRKGAEQTADALRQQGFPAAHYHAEVGAAERRRVQDAFQRDEVRIVCATIAFGMGIDKANIRWVVHYNMPRNVESYYQEIGRSGRDGDPADALMFYSFRDMQVYEEFIAASQADAVFKQVQREKLDRIWDLCRAHSCRTNVILNYFGEYRNEGCGHCDNCRLPPQGFDGTVIAQKALSACARTRQEARLADIADILRGSFRQDIRDQGWDRIKTYGAGRDVSRQAWMQYLTQMVDMGLFEIDYTRQSRLSLTPLSYEVLNGRRQVTLYRTVDAQQKKRPSPDDEGSVLTRDETLYEALRALRLQLAATYRVPPYVIFSDAALRGIVTGMPESEEDLLAVSGIGRFKAEEYGPHVLRVVGRQRGGH